MRRQLGQAETWLYMRSRNSSFVNFWRCFDLTNRTWGAVPAIPYAAGVPSQADQAHAERMRLSGEVMDLPLAGQGRRMVATDIRQEAMQEMRRSPSEGCIPHTAIPMNKVPDDSSCSTMMKRL